MSLTMFITAMAIMLFQSSHLDMLIAGNNRRHNQAKTAAQSGLNHFNAVGYGYDHLKNLSGDANDFILFPNEQMSEVHSYRVAVGFCCDRLGNILPRGQYHVQSTGWYKKGTQHESTAVYQSFYSLDNNGF